MKFDEFSKREVENMRTDALAAIDALEAIVAECDSAYVSRRYLKEKSEKAKWCVGYIASVVDVNTAWLPKMEVQDGQ